MKNIGAIVNYLSGNTFYGVGTVSIDKFMADYSAEFSDNPFDFRQIKADSFGLTEFYQKALNGLRNEYGDEIVKQIAEYYRIPKKAENHVSSMNQFKINKDELRGAWNMLKKIKNAQEKGKMFEELLKDLFSATEELELLNIEQAEDEEIDIVLKNKVNNPFWINLNSPTIMIEAKNWTKKSPTNVINTLDGKMNNHENFCRVGLIISMNGFTKPNGMQQERKNNRHIIGLITGEEIEKFLKNSQNLIEWLEESLTNAFR
jgi:hypothetical protein